MLITVTGPDHPGVTAVLFAALTRHGVDLLDVEQVVIRGRLTLGALVATDHDPEGLQDSVEQAMASVGMAVQTRTEVDDDPSRRSSSHVVVVLGRPITAHSFAQVARALAGLGANIDAIRRVADYPVTGLELAVSLAAGGTEAELRATLVEVAGRAEVDVAVERFGLARRSKRLIVF
ncbi:MAG: ACT domain-containing protein, partial [Pseudonocardiaceae bacterium]